MSWIIDNVPFWVWLVILGGGGGALLAFVPGALALVVGVWNMLPPKARWFLAGIAALFAAYFGGRYRGARNEKDRRDQANAGALQTRKEVDDEVRKDSDAAIDRKLGRWMRDD